MRYNLKTSAFQQGQLKEDFGEATSQDFEGEKGDIRRQEGRLRFLTDTGGARWQMPTQT
jgi:hypothetical protein